MLIQVLERRRFFSIQVEEGYPGFWELYGEAVAADTINIEFRVIDGARNLVVNNIVVGPGDFAAVYTYGGNDSVTVRSIGGAGGGAGVHLGEGDDSGTLDVAGGALWGGPGSDTLKIRDAYRSEIYGEEGNDFIYVEGVSPDHEVRGGDGNDSMYGYDYTYAQFTGVRFSGDGGNDTLFGSNGNDILYGDSGNDTIHGLGGDDAIYSNDGVSGNDIITGGAGYDVLVYDGPHEAGIYGVEMGYPE